MRIGGEEMLSWGGANPEQTLHALLQAVAWLLTPDAGDSASLGIGEVGRSPMRAEWLLPSIYTLSCQGTREHVVHTAVDKGCQIQDT